MQDPRLRLFATVVLSVAAFASTAGSLAALAWWRGQPDALSDPAAVLHRLPAAYRSSARVLRVEQQPWVRQVMTPQGPRALTSRVPVLRVPTPASQEALPVLPLPGSRLTPATP